MSIEAELREEYDRSERRETAVIAVLPYVLLALSTLIALPQSHSAARVATILGLAAATGLWMALFLRLRTGWQQSIPLMGLYFAGLTVMAAALVALAPFYGIFAFIGYVHTFLFLRGRWRYLGAATTSMIMAMAYLAGPASITADEEWWLWAAVSLVSTVLSGTFMHFAEASYSHGRRQKDGLAELHEANVKLRAALEENAGLHAQLVAQAREAGVLDERQRLAREIHDTLAQNLAGILTQLQAADQTLDASAASHRHVTTAMHLARESLTEARHTVHAVQAPALAVAHLPEAINDVVTRWSQANGVEAVLTTTGDPRILHSDIEVALLRSAQEALANVAKHAGASRVGLTLSYMEDLVTLDVRDDGTGFNPTAQIQHTTDGGFGLVGMRQRVQRLTGRLDIESEPGGGTAISASLPAIPPQDGAE